MEKGIRDYNPRKKPTLINTSKIEINEKLGLSITLSWKSLFYQLQKNGKRNKIKKYILINLQNKGLSSPTCKHTSHIG